MPKRKGTLRNKSRTKNSKESKVLNKAFLANIQNIINPILEKLRLSLNKDELLYLKILEQQLAQLIKSGDNAFECANYGLTLKEIAICSLIKNKMSSKEIAKFLHVSPLTVQTHRSRIRKKMELLHNHKSLQTILNKRFPKNFKTGSQRGRK